MDFEVLHTPGHSRGSVCLYLPGEGALFSGDTLFRAGYGRLDLYGGKMGDMLRSLKALFRLPGDVKVYPGHGEATTIGEERARYRL
jgi:glyoxylase-like metal-dependent hydrolase (beta-lactamase superfamily II)